jgi:hypothetical protein
MKRIVPWVVGLVVLGGVACGGDDSSTGTESGPDAGDAGSDSNNVVPLSDAGSDTGAINDAGTDGYTGPATFCSGKTSAFCNDFDRSTTNVALGWDSQTVETGGALTLSTTESKSAPQSAAVALATNAGAKRVVLDKRILSGAKRHIRVSFAWKLTNYTLGTGEGFAFFAVSEDDGTTTVGSTITVSHGKADGWRVGLLTSTTSSPTSSALTAPAFGKWVDVVVDIVFSDATTGSISVSFDGVVAGTMTNVKTSEKATMSGLRFTMGAGGFTATGPQLVAYYDDVQMELP